ncbi:LacI family DNA-binding transcriptional regulator [Aeromicrobium sp. 9AM]|uniref:LacI family DNA-binding transcriptional regulator n=1 Tax=Aeromicrobium sp. 9AM TaxID=2653126 RepID=UPI0012F04897|nr:LacI family DNA-binding transcriptional regulator [Aeromicrobium sp. 9AM]VXB55858.1 LacI family transcriptional regulator [Aeromicrobium sp. 9AM]
MTANSQHAPVMADVAKVAGVSHQTVSRVINGMPNIKDSTRERVEAAIKELGYRPNTAARALVTRKSSTIGIISTESGLYGPNSIHRTVEDAARQAGYFAGSVSLPTVTAQSLTDAIDHLLRQSVEGIVMIAAQYEALEAISRQDPGVPLVIVEGDLSKAKSAVGVDQHRGAYQATTHLIELGHTTIAHVRGPLEWTEAEARRQGWEDALRAAGLELGPLYLGDWTPRSGYIAGRQLASEGRPSAVFVANDQMAIGLMHALHETGIAVPDDISVVGFDDTPETEFLNPPLTTVRQNFQEVGRRAIDVLHAAILGQNEDLPRLIDPELIIRSSTSAPTLGKAQK